jgi:amino acid permease
LSARHFSAISIVNLAANLIILAQIATVFADTEPGIGHLSSCSLGFSSGLIAMLSAMMQTVTIQMCALPMYEEMEHRNPERFKRVVVISFSILFLLFSAFSVMAYLAFGWTVFSNVLVNLPMTPWGCVTRLLAAAAVAGVYPIIVKALIAPLKSAKSVAQNHRAPLIAVAKVLIVVAVMIVAFFLTDLGYVNVLNGAVSLGAFVALAPALVGLHLLQPAVTERPSWRLAMYALLVFGLIFAVLGCTYSDNYASNLQAACIWRAYDGAPADARARVRNVHEHKEMPIHRTPWHR